MTKTRFRAFEHVERLDPDKVDVAAILDSDEVYVFPKMDGTNASVWCSDGEIHCGSRKREVSIDNDNGGFCAYITQSDDEQIANLRDFCRTHSNLIVYGEYIGHVPQAARFLGSIKTYLDGGFFIFAVFDIDAGRYLTYPEYSKTLCGIYDKVLKPVVLDHPKVGDIESLVDDNHYNLPPTETGEGVVVYNYGYRDAYGHFVISKIVRAEYKESKSKPKKQYTLGEIEQEFVDTVITCAFMDKCRNKVCQMLDAEEFDTSNPKHVNIFLNLLVSDSIDEDIYTFVKKKRFPTIDFNLLKNEIMLSGRKFIGLA